MIDCFIDIYNKIKKRFFNNSKRKNQDLSNQLLKKTEWL